MNRNGFKSADSLPLLDLAFQTAYLITFRQGSDASTSFICGTVAWP